MDSGEVSVILDEIVGLQAEQCEATVYLATEDRKTRQISYASLTLSGPLADKFKQLAISRLHNIAELNANGDLQLRPLANVAKMDDFDVDWLDISLLPAIKSRVEGVPQQIAQVPVFIESDHELPAALKYYVLALQPQAQGSERVLFFRKFNPKYELRRSKLFGIVYANGVFDQLTQPAMLFDDHFDCFCRGDAMFVQRKPDFQTIFGYFEQLQQKASACLQKINSVIPISNFSEFALSCGSHKQKWMKLANINDSPYLQSVTIADLKKVIEKFSLVGVRIVMHDGEEHLEFDPKNRWVILKLLDDDYLSSVMTDSAYEVSSKRKVN